MVNHDPPLFAVGFAGSIECAKDSLRNVLESKELVINTISDHFIEAANFTSINAPYAVNEWALSGLTPIASSKVKPPRVHESIFTIECKVVEHKEWKNPEGKVTGVTIFAEGVMFHAREDAINADKNLLDPAVLRSVARLGGITYSCCTDGFEMPRPDFDKELAEGSLEGLLKEN
jgi:flavin reductase (DIM6/NTAB) family NADH-FMN oxidoreductase RutF